MRAIAKRGVEGGEHGESILRVIRFSDFTLIGESGVDLRVGMRSLGVVRFFGRTVSMPLGRLFKPGGKALVGDRAPCFRTAQQVARANAGICHAACFLMRFEVKRRNPNRYAACGAPVPGVAHL